MLNTFEKTKAHEARRAAIQRQMEAMEAAASSRSVSNSPTQGAPSGGSVAGSQSSTTRRRGGGGNETSPQGNLETARRFLWDEDEVDVAGSQPPKMTGSKHGKTDDRRNLYSANPTATTGRSMFGALGSIFGGNKSAPSARMTTVQIESRRNVAGTGETESSYRPSLLTSCYIFFRSFIVRLALTMGSCYTWMRTRWAMAMGNGRGRRLCLALSIILVVVIPVAIFAPGATSGGLTSSLSASRRFDMVSKRIINSGVTEEEVLTKGNSPQNKALTWIVAEDPAQLDPDDKYLLARYSLAVFYFSTHGSEMFQVATINITQTIPPIEEDTDLGVGESAAAASTPEDSVTTIGDDLAAQPNWVHESGWLSGNGICSWYGVECHHRVGTSIFNTRYDDNNGLILLNMTENNVRGQIPREIFLANPDLRWFSLSGNGFFGTIPNVVGSLTQMRYLSFANNFFTGTVPESVTAMTDLDHFYVDGNYMNGRLPNNIGAMTGLESLSFYNNFFSGTLSPDIGKLVNLTSLYLDINHFTGSIPPEIGQLSLLVDLRLRHNRLTGPIPAELEDITGLEILYLDRNTMTGKIPTTLGRLTKLIELHIYRNKVGGAIPSELGLLKELGSLYIDNNHLTGGIPTEFGNLNRLEQIYMHKNYMNGTIPTEIGRMESLSNFRIYTNGFVGTVPSELGAAFNLEDVYLQDNVFSGTIPVEIAELSRLQKLRLYWNRFEGSIPKKVCDLMEFRLTEFKSDCAGDTPKINCECCTACFA